MAVTYGFYNSVNNDRTYSAEQMGSIFDGIIKDGVYQAIGGAFSVTASTGMGIVVGPGRAWFNRTWTFSDSSLPMTLDTADPVLARVDTVVIEVDKRASVRKNSIKIIKGTPVANPPANPPYKSSDPDVFRYPLAYIKVKPLTNYVTAADITRTVGTANCPFVVGVLESLSADTFLARWEAQYSQWFVAQKSEIEGEMTSWKNLNQTIFNNWYANLQSNLDGDAASKLAAAIQELKFTLESIQTGSVIYHTIDDSNGNTILDSYGQAIRGRLIYTVTVQ